MKIYKFCLAVLLSLCFVAPALSSPRLLFDHYNSTYGMADPRAFVLGDDLIFSGTYKEYDDDPRIHFFSVPLANINFSNIVDYVTKYPYIYNTEMAGDEYTEVMSGSMFIGVGGESLIMWSALQNDPCNGAKPCSEAETGFQAVNGGNPAWINLWSNTLPHSEKAWPNDPYPFNMQEAIAESLRIRMPSKIFHDDTNNDGVVQATEPQYNIYNYYYHGNHVAAWQWKGIGAQAAAINLADPFSPGGCAEGGTIFKRGSYYYLIFSRGWWDSDYHQVYKKATSVNGLVTASESNLSGNVYIGNNHYTKNSGNGDVTKIGNDYYHIFHVATPTNGASYLYKDLDPYYIMRKLYIQKLVFDSGGNISIVQLP